MRELFAVVGWPTGVSLEDCAFAAIVLVGVAFICLAIKRRRMMLGIGIVLFVFGCVVYIGATPPFEAGADADGALNRLVGACSKSLSAFYPSRGQYDNELAGSHSYWIFHVLAIIYVTAILVVLFGMEIVNRLVIFAHRLKGMFHGGGCMNVFWGCNEESKTIAKGVEEGKGSVVFVLPERRLWTRIDDDDDIHSIAKSGWKWIIGTTEDSTCVSSAGRHFFMGADGHKNVADAEALIRGYTGARQMMVYVRVSATADDDVLYKWADKWNRDSGKNVEVVIVREESLVSRRLLLRAPMLKCPNVRINTKEATVEGSFKVLVLGFGAQGEMLLNDMICDSQYLTSTGKPAHFEAHVVDRDPTSYGSYEVACSEAVDRYSISFVNSEVGSTSFWNGFKKEMAEQVYDRVVVCLPDDRENIYVASDIAKTYREMCRNPAGVVFARVRDSLIDGYIRSVFDGNESIRTFTPFGAMSDTYSYANIVTRRWEKGAIWLNGDYKKKADEPHDEAQDALNWKTASFFNKESSRASFFHQRNLLRLIGYVVEEDSDDNNVFNDADPMNHLDVLAEDEHLRWMAYHFVRGVKKWSPTCEEIEAKAANSGREVVHNAIAGLNAHADLEDFSKLPAVDALFDKANMKYGHHRDKDTQEKDKGFIRSEAMRRSGLGIRRI